MVARSVAGAIVGDEWPPSLDKRLLLPGRQIIAQEDVPVAAAGLGPASLVVEMRPQRPALSKMIMA
jgi:hypothetical protein